MTGWRLYVLTFALCLSLFLSTLETTIVSTSLISITDALGGFDERDWVVTSYLITYTGFLVIYAKFSDVLGRKPMLLLAVGLFTVFSIVCGSISSLLQLIIFRAFQGMGASGIYAMVTVMNPEMVPSSQWGTYVAITSVVFVLSSVLGPVLGGVINGHDHSSWRWVFLLNAPTGAIATGLIAFLLPNHFPYKATAATASSRWHDKFTLKSLARLDLIGAFLLLASSILLVFGFEEAGARYPWSSAAVLSTLIIGGLLLVGFVIWEKVVSHERFVQEPVFPLRLMKDRRFVGMTIVGLLTGPPFMTVLINLPQRFQAVSGSTPFEAGIHLLPLLLSSPLATALAGQLVSKGNVPPFYMLLAGASLQLLGLGLASSAGVDGDKMMYGFEVIMGFSFGMTLIMLIVYVPFVVERADMAVGISSITQIRVLGGTIGLAISATVLNHALSSRLPAILSPSQMQEISDSLSYIAKLPEAQRDAVRLAYNEAFNEQFRVMLYFSAVVWLACLLLWERKMKTVRDIEGY
ncbi:MFS general substrate transporter [Coniochaeta ligniaria NRRL 30616]|uniref:MFS general substrate transporter n=1 Tax=Coniochaeta ligniaria NRRL 30616 TaxID=1408157 RepID=A0A1J7IMG6_9PEZI|nr:MFS general substrate transporter [Coniochaeta ligniaria NRRL 30616]